MAAASSSSARYWCHECSSEVAATEQPDGFQCRECSGIFVEVMEEGDPRLVSSPSTTSSSSTASSSASSTISSTSSSASASPPLPPPSISFAGPNGIQFNFHSLDNPAMAAAAPAANHQPFGNIFQMAQQVMQQMFQPPVNGGGVDAGGNPQQQQQPPPFMFPFGFPPPGQQGQGLGSHGPGGVGPAPFNINQMMQMILGGGGPGGGGGAGFPMGGLGGGQGAPPVIAGDFVFGDLQQVINRLMQMDQGRFGAPPATTESLAALEDLKVDDDLKEHLTQACGVCQDDFALQDTVTMLPCTHYYHRDCVRPWLEQHCTCPICRYNLNTGRIEPDKPRGRR